MRFKSVSPKRVKREDEYEKNLSTEKETKKQSARIPRENENERRQENACEKTQQRQKASFRVTDERNLPFKKKLSISLSVQKRKRVK